MRLFDMDSREDYLLDGKYKVATPYAPCVDVVEVVRCKNCKHYIDPQIEDELGVRCVQWHTARFTREDDFCSYGERREP